MTSSKKTTGLILLQLAKIRRAERAINDLLLNAESDTDDEEANESGDVEVVVNKKRRFDEPKATPTPKKTHRKFTEEENEKMMVLLHKNVPKDEVARLFNLSNATSQGNDRIGKWNKLTKTKKDELLAKHEDYINEILEELDLKNPKVVKEPTPEPEDEGEDEDADVDDKIPEEFKGLDVKTITKKLAESGPYTESDEWEYDGPSHTAYYKTNRQYSIQFTWGKKK